jgi:hypothetical protein
MTTFGYYSNSDPTEEIITKKQFRCWIEALMYWCGVKQLDAGQFTNLFTIKEIK